MVSGLTPVGPLLWQAEADTELTLSASPTTAVGQKALAMAKRRYSTVIKIRLLIYVFAFRTLRMAQKSFTTKPKGHLRKRTSRSEMMAESLSSMLKLTKHALPY